MFTQSLLPLATLDVHLWLARPERSEDPPLLRAYEALLSPAERERHRGFTVARARREHLLTRALVRTTLSRYRRVEPAAWRFARAAHGRPELDPPCGLRFNLSNTAGLVACAVAWSAVGVDVEGEARADAILEVAPRVFSASERATLARLRGPARRERALALWTLKEAYAKARGLGLSLPFQAFSIAFDGPGGDGVALSPPPGDARAAGRWELRVLRRDAHRVAVAVEALGGPVRLRAFETTPLVPGADLEVDLAEDRTSGAVLGAR